MTNLEVMISEMKSETSAKDFDKKSYLADCARRRIVLRSQSYNDHFDHLLSLIEKSEIGKEDFSRTCSTLISLSSLITSSYSEMIKMIKSYDKQMRKGLSSSS